MNRRRRRRLAVFHGAVYVVLGLFFLLPIAAMLEFATRGVGIGSPRTLTAFTSIGSDPMLVDAITASLELALITSAGMLALLLPTMIWARLRLPKLVRPLELVSLMPLTIPAIVLVVGFAPIYRWIEINVSDSILMLSFAYLVLVLPYCYRALAAGLASVDVRTLSEAARSLGAGWGTVVWRIIVPNMSSSVFNAILLCVAVVLGEFTVASLLNFENLQVAISILGTGDAQGSIALAVLSLVLVFVFLFALTFLGRFATRRRGAAKG